MGAGDQVELTTNERRRYEHAKQVLINQYGVSEKDAHLWYRRVAMTTQVSKLLVADLMIGCGDLLHGHPLSAVTEMVIQTITEQRR